MQALVIQPVKQYQEVLSQKLEELSITPVFVNSGKQALDKLQTQHFALVITDFDIGDMNGIELTKAIRKKPAANQHIPVLLFAPDSKQDTFLDGLQSGITEVFSHQKLTSLFDCLEYYSETLNAREKLSGHVLVIDDDKAIVNFLTTILDSMGLTSVTTSNAKEGIRLLEVVPFDLIITDFMLEGNVTGHGLIQTTRKIFSDKIRMPILAISGLDDPARRTMLLNAGANDYIAKPILPEEFMARVSNLITIKKLFDENELQRSQLEKMARTDQLTGLYNRHSMMWLASKHIGEAVRHSYPLSLAILDIDHFKSVNDNHGHSAGDEVLKEIATLLKENFRNEDYVARFGGEEFVIILTHCGIDAAITKIEQVRKRIENLRPADMYITASFGVSELAKDRYTFNMLFNSADAALYQAKGNGRNQVCAVN